MKKLICMICLSAMLLSCGSEDKKNITKKAVKVKTAVVQIAEPLRSQEYSFIAKPMRTSELSFRISGVINQFEQYAGTTLKQGDLIAAIDNRDFLIRKERAEALYQHAKTEFNRVEALFLKNNISASVYDKSKADYTTAKTAYEMAVNELSDTRLTAPFSGYIGEVYIEKHQDIKQSQRVVSMVDNSSLKIEIYVPQEVAVKAQTINDVELRFDALPNERFIAQVVEVSKSTTPNNLSYLLTALLPNKDGKLLAGMSGKVIFSIDYNTDASVIIPQSAVCHRASIGDFVWVVDGATSTVTMRSVELGKVEKNGVVHIKRGLNSDDVVAISSLRFLSDNISINAI